MKTESQDILAHDGTIEARICIDCQAPKPIDQFQRTPKGGRASDCKVCRRKKYEDGLRRKQEEDVPATKEWVIKEAKKLYDDSRCKLNDKIKLLDTIARNISGDARSVTDDAKVVAALKESMKKMKEMGK